MKKAAKKRGLYFALAFMLTVGFCLAGIPAKRVRAGLEGAVLKIGDTTIVDNGQFVDNNDGDDDAYIGQNFKVVEDGTNYRITLSPGDFGAIYVKNMALFISVDASGDYNIAKNKDADSDYYDYSVYCEGGRIEFLDAPAPLDGSEEILPTFNFEGGISNGGAALRFSEGTFFIGNGYDPASVGIAGFGIACEQDEQYSIYLKGRCYVNIYADTAIGGGPGPDDAYAYVEVTNGAFLHIDATECACDVPAQYTVSHEGGVYVTNVEAGVDQGSNKYICSYIDPDKEGYDVNYRKQNDGDPSGKQNNTTYKETQNGDDNEYYSMSLTDGALELISKQKQLTAFGWNTTDIKNGGGFKVLNGVGFLMNVTTDEEGNEDYTYNLIQGTELEIEVLPKYGYQFNVDDITRAANDVEKDDIKAQNDVATYKLPVSLWNVHLAEAYREVTNDADASKATSIDGANIVLDKAEDTSNFNGNLRLTVEDAENANEEGLMNELGDDKDDYELFGVYDLTVNSVVTQGDTDGVWKSEPITEFQKDAEVYLYLEGEVEPGTKAKVVREHQNGKNVETEVLEGEVVEVQVPGENGEGTNSVPAVRVSSDRFSTYAIALEATSDDDDDDDDGDDDDNDDDDDDDDDDDGDGDDDDNDDDDVDDDGDGDDIEPGPDPEPIPEPGPEEQRILVKDEATGINVEISAYEGPEHYKLRIESFDLLGAPEDELAEGKEFLNIPEGYEFLEAHEIFMLSDINEEGEFTGKFDYEVYGREPVIYIPVEQYLEVCDLKLLYYVHDDWETKVEYPEFTIENGMLVVSGEGIETDGDFVLLGKAIEWNRITITDQATGISVTFLAPDGPENYKLDIEEQLGEINDETMDYLRLVYDVPEDYEVASVPVLRIVSSDPDKDITYYNRLPVTYLPLGEDVIELYNIKILYINAEDESDYKYLDFTVEGGNVVIDQELDGTFVILVSPKEAETEAPTEEPSSESVTEVPSSETPTTEATSAKEADISTEAATEATTQAGDSSPQTGDSSDPALMLMLLFASAGLVIMSMKKSKEMRNK